MSVNSSGYLKITLPHLNAKSDALEALSTSQHDASFHVVTPMVNILPIIIICSVPSGIDDANIKQCVMNKNSLVLYLISAGEEFQILFFKLSGNGFKSVVIHITPLVRDVIIQTLALYIAGVGILPAQ